MKAINVLLSVLISLLIGAAVLEGGLRLIGKGPDKTLLDFDEVTGWSNVPGRTKTLHKGPITVHYKINEIGLRDDPLPKGGKPDGVYSIVALGDSFTLGYAVERDEHFVDLLEQAYRSEGRAVEVWNVGAEGWDTAQQAAWLEEHGAQLEPDLILHLPFQNDLYWNSQDHYATADGPRQKPRYQEDGNREARALTKSAPKPWHQHFALTKWLRKPDRATLDLHNWRYPGAARPIAKELAPLLPPTEFDASIRARTRGALIALQRKAGELDADLVMAPIPPAPAYSEHWKEVYESVGAGRGLAGLDWSTDRPLDLFLELAGELGIDTLDVRSTFDGEPAAELYWEADWHLSPFGSSVFASFLKEGLGERDGLATPTTQTTNALAQVSGRGRSGLPFAAKLFAGLWVLLSGLYIATYPEEPKWLPPLKVGLLLGAVFGIFIGLGKLQTALPAPYGNYLPLAFLVGILGFVVFKLGSRVGTITELIGAFIRRGHWYLMPLVVVLLSIGSLLVVAASSPLVAPFIYTLF